MSLRDVVRCPVVDCFKSPIDQAIKSAVNGVAADADVTAFATAVTTAGGALPASHQLALNTYIPALKASGAWALIKELWIPLGNDSDLTTAAVKFKNGATSPTVTLTNFVSTDYTVALGVYTQTGNASKKVVTDFVPATNGSLATGEWGMSYYGTKLGGSGVLMGSAANANTFISNSSGTQSKIAGTVVSLQPTNSPAGEQGGNIRLSSVQYTGGNATAYTGGWAHNVVAGTAVSQTGGLSLFSTNNSFFCSAATGGYAVHAPMTPAQLRALQTFIDKVSTAIGRTIFQDNLTVTGDSYTAPTPTGPSSAANGWCYKVAAARGYAGGWLATPPSGVNAGVPGSGWGPPCSGGQMNNGNSGRDRIFRAVLQNPSKHWMIALGVNDDFQSGTNAAVNSSSAATFQFINDVGYPPEYVAIGTNYWTSASPDGTVGAAIHTTLLANAAAAGFTQIVDFYSGGTFNNTSVEVGVHKNDAGHALMTTDVTNAITAGNWAGW